VIAYAGKPVAKLVAYRDRSRPRKPGSMAGEIQMAADFDSLPEDMAAAFWERGMLGTAFIRVMR
jgi:antitoxin (DNA-binding transcriptional repressor) of toxin-antitoxin stability system